MTLDASALAAPHLQLGSVLYEQRELEDARREFEAALAVQPDLSPARFNLAVICRELEENEKAEALFSEIIASDEIVAESHNNLGILAVRREDDSAAEESFRRAIELRYEFPLAHFNLATLLLRRGFSEEAFGEFEWRWQLPAFVPINCPQPQWEGEYLDGTLLLHTEQGIGDVFQYARFIPMIRERCRRLLFLLPERLRCMFPPTKWADEILVPGEIELDSFHAFLPLMSATHALKIKETDLPCGENYLTPDPREISLGPVHVADAKVKVAITWAGSPTHVNDAYRSVTIDRFMPLLDIPGVALYSLQIGPPSSELERLAERQSVVRDLSDLQSDMADAAAILRQMDLVITVDTSLLHLAGGMGVPAWGLLSVRSDWRWLGSERTDSPWYPSVRLFRQKTLGDWGEVMERVANALRLVANDHASLP